MRTIPFQDARDAIIRSPYAFRLFVRVQVGIVGNTKGFPCLALPGNHLIQVKRGHFPTRYDHLYVEFAIPAYRFPYDRFSVLRCIGVPYRKHAIVHRSASYLSPLHALGTIIPVAYFVKTPGIANNRLGHLEKGKPSEDCSVRLFHTLKWRMVEYVFSR